MVFLSLLLNPVLYIFIAKNNDTAIMILLLIILLLMIVITINKKVNLTLDLNGRNKWRVGAEPE